MSSIGDLLFGSDPKPQVTTSTSSSQMPEWYQKFYQALLSRGSEAANAPYVQNPNQRVAPLTSDQNAAYDAVRQQMGAQNGTLSTANQFAQQAGSGFDANALQTYMSPYTQNVVNTIGSLAGRNLSENLLPAVNDTFTRSGQFGSSRHGDFTGRAVRDANESALNQQAQALESGYGTALNAYQSDQARKLSAAGTLGNLATTGQDVGLKGAAALEAAGQVQQQQGQKNLDVANQDWQTQQDYPKNQIQWLSGLFNPSAGGQTTTNTSTTQPSSNNGSSLAGLIGGIGSIGSLIGSFFAEGGAVKKSKKRTLENVTGPGGAAASVPGEMRWRMPESAGFDPEEYYREHGYRLGENPDAPTMSPDMVPQLVLDENGNYVVSGYADGGPVSYMGPEASAADVERSNQAQSNSAFADAFANWGSGNMQETPEQKILRLTAEYGLSEEDAASLVYGNQGYARGGSIGSLRRAA